MGDTVPTEGEQSQELRELWDAIHDAEPVCGDKIYQYFGRRVIEHTTSAGESIAIKVMARDRQSNYYRRGMRDWAVRNPVPKGSNRTEADMMHYAATNRVLAPKVRAVYDIYKDDPEFSPRRASLRRLG